jgi:hypothetical protein
MTIHASEGLTHWYGRDGSPAYQVKGANGNLRPTTLRDARKIGLVPSVTGIIRCADKPGLTNWMIDQAILAALTLPKLQDEPEGAYLARIKRDSKEQAKKAAERGTAIHAAIQGHYEGEPPAQEFWPHVKGAVQAVKDWNAEAAEWVAERSFACRLGFGGKVDLSAFDISSGFILDFKSKEFGPEDDLKTWDEHTMQLAAYREGLGYPDARCAICYVSATVPGLARLIEIEEEDIKKGWKCFYSLLQFWKAKSGFDSSFERAMAA